ncbi:DUF4269 domain-containing protein [Novosphingobium guangzhouense]|uniref:Phage capsid protein n=1 Tax=Novosphingobium guangzhouense TaxID=1850347 RepID=A0A2K2G5N3_9SPHN|nr:DUF4269 domain-containing protein [Novosphingobium guangzhouense]PNU06332.1 hypothetical protein A8V01_01910 [Novosphingobium guangzhouense]
MSANWRAALDRSNVLTVLAAFDPRVAGTFPLGIDVPGSDIDVLCHAPDAHAFARVVWGAFAGAQGFAMHQWAHDERAVVAGFTIAGVPFELFGSPVPVDAQMGWRHFEIERRLLDERGDDFRASVMAARRRGMKTEPAFAHVLGLEGDPYAALLRMADGASTG